MNVLVLGGGLQGRAALLDLSLAADVTAITCADARPAAVQPFVDWLGSPKIRVVSLDAGDREALARCLDGGFDVVIDLLPRQFIPVLGELAIAAGLPLVNTYYDHALQPLAAAASAAGVPLLPECGFDPGIDLVLYGELLRRFDRLEELRSYGGGFPAPAADDNPLRYKISWTWEGVLNSYDRPARCVVDGQVVETPAAAMFDDPHRITVPGVGELEAFVNGDAASYVERLGLRDTVRDAARYTLRWPGHCALWRALVGLGLLDQTPVPGLGDVTPRQFMIRHLEPRLQYQPDEQDVIALRVEGVGLREGQRRRLILDLVDRRDLATGLLAMNRAVGFPAAIAARLLASGQIQGTGLLSPATHVPYEPFVTALAGHGLVWREEETAA